MGRTTLTICPFPWGCQHHLIRDSLGSHQSTAKRLLDWFSYFARLTNVTNIPTNIQRDHAIQCFYVLLFISPLGRMRPKTDDILSLTSNDILSPFDTIPECVRQKDIRNYDSIMRWYMYIHAKMK